jgi:hypothetical protein
MSIPPVSGSEAGGEQPAHKAPPPQEPVPTYLAPAVLVTLLCCLPAGIVAIYFSSRVSSLQAVGNRVGAYQAADKARLWCWLAAIFGLIWPLIVLSAIFAGGIGVLDCLDGCNWN